MRGAAAGLVAACILSSPLAAQGGNPGGTWQGTITDPDGTPHPMTLVLKAEGATLSGTITVEGTPIFAQSISHGHIAGDDISFDIALHGPDPAESVTLRAHLAGDSLQGSAAMQGQAFPFTLMRATGKPPVPAAREDTMAAVGPPQPRGAEPRPEDAGRAILAAFDRYDVVAGLGVTGKEADDLILDLVRDAEFAGKVNDIAIECGNSLYQPLLDRYTEGGAVSLAEVRQVWRNTTQPSCGYSWFYDALIPLVRRVNARLPADRRLRVLACDPPIDWSKVRSRADLGPFMDRDAVIVAVIEREVLAKHRKALVPFGINHMRHGRGAARRIEADYPNSMWVVADYHGWGGTGDPNRKSPLAQYNDQLESRMAAWPTRSLVALAGTWLADLPCAYFDANLPAPRCRGYPGVDALLYFGPRDLLVEEPRSPDAVTDTAYATELRRRAAIRAGPSSPTQRSPGRPVRR